MEVKAGHQQIVGGMIRTSCPIYKQKGNSGGETKHGRVSMLHVFNNDKPNSTLTVSDDILSGEQ